ncbi:hypothetical protein EOE65_11600 [Neptunomonas marina]|uniref:CheW-like domain-containing protein n=3 Tax=Neptunomonas TaxID=75687 RepID=A0A437Q6Y2_9GAMM|nr:hypothetical protein EOE65_11600 [Neptunomonas marina]
MNCILVEVFGVRVALPFEAIEGAISLNSVTMQLDNEHAWVLGSFGSSVAYTRIVDTAGWIMPHKYDAERSSYKEVVILKGRRWALSCDELLQSVHIPMHEINWNSDKTNRPWLMGTYMKEKCAILDIPTLIGEFEEALNL